MYACLGLLALANLSQGSDTEDSVNKVVGLFNPPGSNHV